MSSRSLVPWFGGSVVRSHLKRRRGPKRAGFWAGLGAADAERSGHRRRFDDSWQGCWRLCQTPAGSDNDKLSRKAESNMSGLTITQNKQNIVTPANRHNAARGAGPPDGGRTVELNVNSPEPNQGDVHTGPRRDAICVFAAAIAGASNCCMSL